MHGGTTEKIVGANSNKANGAIIVCLVSFKIHSGSETLFCIQLEGNLLSWTQLLELVMKATLVDWTQLISP
jgi:hypothetical protein